MHGPKSGMYVPLQDPVLGSDAPIWNLADTLITDNGENYLKPIANLIDNFASSNFLPFSTRFYNFTVKFSPLS